MSDDARRQRNPEASRKRMRSWVLGGGRPPLDGLSAQDVAAAQHMLLNGEAEISCHSCRLFLTARVDDEPAALSELIAGIGRLVRGRRRPPRS